MADRYTDYEGYVCSDWLNDVDWLLVESAGSPRSAAELRNNIGAVGEAPIDGGEYVRQDGGWVANSGGGGGISHNSTTSRDSADAHPTSAITGLDTTLSLKIEEAPVDDSYYARRNSVWQVLPSGGGDPIDHNETNQRTASDCHPTSAITGLDAALALKADITYVDTELAAKADTTDLDAKLDADDPADGKTYGRKDNAWEELDLTGGGGGGTVSANPNLLINSGFKVNQRFFTSDTGDGFMAVDRWAFKMNGFNQVEGSVVTENVETFYGNNALRFKQILGETIAVNDYSALIYKFDGDTFDQLDWNSGSGRSVTLSFTAYTSSATHTMSVGMRNADEDRVWLTTVVVTTTRSRFSVVIPAFDEPDKFGEKDAHAATLFFTYAAGANHLRSDLAVWQFNDDWGHNSQTNRTGSLNVELHISDVKLEIGTNVTPYTSKTFSEELISCQRYYFTYPYQQNSLAWRTNVVHPGAYGERELHLLFPTYMRAIPSMSITGFATGGNFTSGMPKTDNKTRNTCVIEGDVDTDTAYSTITRIVADAEFAP